MIQQVLCKVWSTLLLLFCRLCVISCQTIVVFCVLANSICQLPGWKSRGIYLKLIQSGYWGILDIHRLGHLSLDQAWFKKTKLPLWNLKKKGKYVRYEMGAYRTADQQLSWSVKRHLVWSGSSILWYGVEIQYWLPVQHHFHKGKCF